MTDIHVAAHSSIHALVRPANSGAPPGSKMTNATTRILYIEDDRASQRLVQRVLGSFGYVVDVADDGLDGIAIARDRRPQLILMDINLPDMDGREITTRLRSLPTFASTPIVALTANTSPGSREQALAAGCTGFLSKPIDVIRFPEQVEQFLGGYVEEMPEDERKQELERYAQRLVDRLENKVYELQSANRRLRELDRMKSDFIVLVSHELRTPLTLVSGYAYLLRERLDANSADSPAMLNHIADGLNLGVDRLRGVIEEIISVSRIASGTLDLALGPVRIDRLLERAAERVQPACEARELKLEVTISERLPVVDGDGTQLQIAVDNVVGNAVKFTPDGGEIALGAREVGDTVHITIRDNGIGVPADQQRRIFDQFYRLGEIEHHSTSKSAFQGGGLGIGLAIARGIVDAHNGRIWVETPEQQRGEFPGSIFHILLPIHPADF